MERLFVGIFLLLAVSLHKPQKVAVFSAVLLKCLFMCEFRICIDPNDEMKAGLLAQAESGDDVLTAGMWQHLAFTYSQQPEGKKNIHGQLTLWVGGIR